MSFTLSHKIEPYASHQPILAAIAETIHGGKIIEYGTGNYSTGLLHYICQKNENYLYSIENDKKWLEQVKEQYPGHHWHSYIDVEDYTDLIDKDHDFSCDLAFVDGYTFGTRLFCIMMTMAAKSWKYIVVHDCDFLKGARMTNITMHAGVKEYNNIWPPTALIFNSHAGVSINHISIDMESDEVDDQLHYTGGEA